MAVIFRVLPVLLAAAFLLAGCYIKPVRHLASDAALIKVGVSKQEDVLVYLGDPDEQLETSDGGERWIYKDVKKTIPEKIPYLGEYIGAPEYQHVIVTFRSGIVTDCVFTTSDADYMDWADDYSWQKKQ